MGTAKLYQGDVREVLRQLPERSVQCVVTSPPYWGLRDYGTAKWDGGTDGCDHRQPVSYKSSTLGASTGGRSEATHRRNIEVQATPYPHQCGKCGARRIDAQLGLERTPEEYVANMVEVFREVRRVLRDDGTCWLNLGDSYNGYMANQRATSISANNQHACPVFESGHGRRTDTLKPKDLVGIPWRVAFALQADGWWLRSDIIWSKPNPMPESVTDRPTRSHEYLFLLTKSQTYYFDAQAIAEPANPASEERYRYAFSGAPEELPGGDKGSVGKYARTAAVGMRDFNATRNARSVWTIATQPYPQAHFATFPEELARRCILAGSSNRACEHCGAPWERVTERPPGGATQGYRPDPRMKCPTGKAIGSNTRGMPHRATLSESWQPTCSCENTGSAVSTVLDPFGGSGTVSAVASGNGRNSIYIDLNPKYLELARQRIGPMLCGVA